MYTVVLSLLSVARRGFFAGSSGFFTNYTWSDSNLDASAGAARSLQRSPLDVFVGVDVFARGCPGKFASALVSLFLSMRTFVYLLHTVAITCTPYCTVLYIQRTTVSSCTCNSTPLYSLISQSIQKICERSLSVAIFAPAWTYEKLNRRQHFLSVNETFVLLSNIRRTLCSDKYLSDHLLVVV